MKVRAIPFGYKYEIGKVVIDESTACIVREIFTQYINGKSLLNISAFLNNLHIEYRPGVTGWNKARIKHILEDERYLGNSEFPVIVTEKIFEKANEVKNRRCTTSNIDKNSPVYQLAPVCCPYCSNVMKRIYDTRNKNSARWKCTDSGCHKIIPISDEQLLSEIKDLINGIINNPDVIRISSAVNPKTTEVTRTEYEINRILDSHDVNIHNGYEYPIFFFSSYSPIFFVRKCAFQCDIWIWQNV